MLPQISSKGAVFPNAVWKRFRVILGLRQRSETRKLAAQSDTVVETAQSLCSSSSVPPTAPHIPLLLWCAEYARSQGYVHCLYHKAGKRQLFCFSVLICWRVIQVTLPMQWYFARFTKNSCFHFSLWSLPLYLLCLKLFNGFALPSGYGPISLK